MRKWRKKKASHNPNAILNPAEQLDLLAMYRGTVW